MKNEKIVFGIIGLGNISQRQHLPNLARSTKIHLKTVCDLNEELLFGAQNKYNVPNAAKDSKELLADPEIQAVVIATREETHAELSIEALKAGKHVYVEKPLSDTVEKCEEVMKMQKQTGKIVSLGYNRRFAPAYQKAKELIVKDGGVRNLHYRLSDDSALWAIRMLNIGMEIYKPMGNRLFFEICHIFDVIRWFCDSDVESVWCVESRKDEEAILLKMKSGSVATIMTTGYASADMPKERLDVITGAGGVSVEEFCELRTFGYADAKPMYRFPGHTHPDREYTHRLLLEKLGAEAIFAMRRNNWEITEKLINSSDDPAQYALTNCDLKVLSSTIKDNFFDKEEMINYVALDGNGPIIAYMVDKGWVGAVEALAENIRIGKENPDIATVTDGLKATQLAFAAAKSRETGGIVKL